MCLYVVTRCRLSTLTNKNLSKQDYYCYYIITIIIIIIIILSIVSRFFSTVLLLNQQRSPPLILQVSDCSTVRITCDVTSTAVCCSEYVECFTAVAYKYVFKPSVTIPVAPIMCEDRKTLVLGKSVV